jgi:hypothetical protein
MRFFEELVKSVISCIISALPGMGSDLAKVGISRASLVCLSKLGQA